MFIRLCKFTKKSLNGTLKMGEFYQSGIWLSRPGRTFTAGRITEEQNGGKCKDLQDHDIVSWVRLTFETLTNEEMSPYLEPAGANG